MFPCGANNPDREENKMFKGLMERLKLRKKPVEEPSKQAEKKEPGKEPVKEAKETKEAVKKARKPEKEAREPKKEKEGPEPEAKAPEAQAGQEGGAKSTAGAAVKRMTFMKNVAKRRRRNEIAYETKRSQRRMK